MQATKKLGLWIVIGVSFAAFVIQPSFARHHHRHNNHRPIVRHTIQAVYGNQELTQRINQAIKQTTNTVNAINIGVMIKSMKTGEMLYTKNARSLFVPASTMKILTAEAALLLLGPDFTFPTTFMSDAKSVNNGVLDGNVYLVNSGDPSLTFTDLTDLMVTLKSLGVSKITGNIYIDNSAYDEVVYGPGWLWTDKKNCYGAPISASIINHNCLSFSVAPGNSRGQSAKIITNPRFYYSGIRNDVITKSHQVRTCYMRLNNTDNSTISISGCMPQGHYSQGINSIISNVMQYNVSLMRDLFKRFDIQVKGGVAAGTVPMTATALATHQSQPLHILINEMLKMSDNIIAGSLFKKIGQVYHHRAGTWENGGTAVSDILSKQANMNTWHISLIDGSGLSRYNQITPQQMMQILEFAYHNDPTNYQFISSLPIAGVDGTLKRRLQNVAWKIRAKTGTMSGVISLAGYAVTADKEPVAFVIMINGRNGVGWKYKELEDTIVTMLTKYSRAGMV